MAKKIIGGLTILIAIYIIADAYNKKGAGPGLIGGVFDAYANDVQVLQGRGTIAKSSVSPVSGYTGFRLGTALGGIQV